MKINMPKQNHRFRGPMESIKLNNSNSIISKNLSDATELLDSIKIEIEKVSTQSSVILSIVNSNT